MEGVHCDAHVCLCVNDSIKLSQTAFLTNHVHFWWNTTVRPRNEVKNCPRAMGTGTMIRDRLKLFKGL